MDGTSIGPYSTQPRPHPRRQQKSPARGQNKLKNTDLMTFYGFYEEVKIILDKP